MKILVAIASYGTGNDQYLSRLINEYRSMPHDLHMVVISNIYKDLPAGIELVVGLPTKHPRSLPFVHKRIFADRANDYDLFIYSEDDILITKRGVDAFLWASTVLYQNEIPGFFLKETCVNGDLNYPQAHGQFHWDPTSAQLRGSETFAFFTNEHAASYMLTRRQLQRALASGGFLVPPYEGRYDMLCSAATDPYTRCGLRKLICISRFDDFCLDHLPNKYIGKFGVSHDVLRGQIEVLMNLARNGEAPAPLFRGETKLMGTPYSKDYYEPVKKAIFPLLSKSTRSVLSIGCGWGATEAELANRGLRVVALPMDRVISSAVKGKGVELINGTFGDAMQQLRLQRFDCLLLLNMLHLIRDPANLLRSFSGLLSNDSQIIASVPNLASLSVLRKRLRGDPHVRPLGSYEHSGLHKTSHRTVRKWFLGAGFDVDHVVDIVPERGQKILRATRSLIRPLLASEMIVVARPARSSALTRTTGYPKPRTEALV